MNKKLISLAVAAAFAAPTAVLADATLYGRIHATVDYVDVEENASYNNPNAPDYKGWDMTSRSSALGVKGSEELGGGLKAIYQIEITIPLFDENNSVVDGETGALAMDDSFVGLAGNWGTFMLARHDTPLNISTAALDQFDDTMADYASTIGFMDLTADHTIVYISPSFSGFRVAGATVPSGGGTAYGATNLDADGISEAYSLAAIYSNGPFYASAAYESLSGELFGPTGAGADDDFAYWRLGLGLVDWNGFTLAGIYENQTARGGIEDDDADMWQIQAGYAFGNSKIKAMYGQADFDDVALFDGDNDDDSIDLSFDTDGDVSSWAIGFDHNLSERTKAYLLYTQLTDDRVDDLDDADWSGFSLGVVHHF